MESAHKTCSFLLRGSALAALPTTTEESVCPCVKQTDTDYSDLHNEGGRGWLGTVSLLVRPPEGVSSLPGLVTGLRTAPRTMTNLTAL